MLFTCNACIVCYAFVCEVVLLRYFYYLCGDLITRVLDKPRKKQDFMKQKTVSVSFMLMGILFCVCLICANLLAIKQIEFGPVNITGGILVFPISYIINDCIAEVWGFRKARLIIWTGFVMNFMFVAFGALADWIPGASYWTLDDGFHAIFGLAPRVAFASFMAFLAGSFLNAYVMSKMKIASNGRHFSARAILSTVAGEFADSIIFFPIALGGMVPVDNLLLMIVSQAVLKTLYEIIVLPLTIRVVNFVKMYENEDAYDTNISYSIFRVSDIG